MGLGPVEQPGRFREVRDHAQKLVDVIKLVDDGTGEGPGKGRVRGSWGGT
jgi:hypothetical protein